VHPGECMGGRALARRREADDRGPAGIAVSYQLCYRMGMANRTKRSVSLSPELAVAIDRAAQESGETFSGWLAATASHRLRIDAGRRGLAEWERAHGALTAAELDEGRSRARALLGLSDAPRRKRRTA
jgi:hypothetical protein